MKKVIIMVDGYPVKVYTNASNTVAYVFPGFGRCYTLSSDQGVLDFATDFLLSKHKTNIVSFQGYLNSLEDTIMTHIENPAA